MRLASSPAFLCALLGLVPPPAAASPQLEGCPVFPADNVWNTRVDSLPVHPGSAGWIAAIGATAGIKADFGSGLYEGAPIGIPFVTVPGTQPPVPVAFDYSDESDPGPYPIPPDAPIEGGPASSGDRHVLVIDRDRCLLYETYYSFPLGGGTSWAAGSGAVFDLRANGLRPAGWTSADAAGLPVFAGLARYEEVATGAVKHALRFTARRTLSNAYAWPARHWASADPDPSLPPMGLRVRLKASKDISALRPQSRVLAQAMKTYGLILADNGSPWYVTGAPSPGWDNDDLRDLLTKLAGADFEVVDTSAMAAGPDTGRVASPSCGAGDSDGDGMADCVDETEGRDPLVKDNDVFGSARLFAMQQYRDFLNREGDPAGVTGWTNLVSAGTYTRPQVIDAFLQSQEFAGLVAPVVRLYFATYLRVPDYAGLTFNAGLVRNGTVTLVQLADFFTASPEFVAMYGSLDNAAFVTLLYNNVLGRAPDAAGLNGWVALLNGGYTRGQVLLGFSDSVEYQAAMAHEVLVTMMYTAMLRRTPEPSGFNGWVGFLDAGTYTREQVIDGFFLSTEYHDRFLP